MHQHRRLKSLAHLPCQRDWVAPLPNLWGWQEGLVDPHNPGLTPPEHGRYRTHQVQPDGMIQRLLEEGPVTLVANGPQELPGFQSNPHFSLAIGPGGLPRPHATTSSKESDRGRRDALS